MSKLPVLFVSCNAETLHGQAQSGSGPARMVWGRSYQSVVLIRTRLHLEGLTISTLKGAEGHIQKIQALLRKQGFTLSTESQTAERQHEIVRSLLKDEPGDLAELSLGTGMTEAEYRRIGECLEVMRDYGALLLCLDDTSQRDDDGDFSLHDRHLRDMINGWVQNQQWESVVRFRGDVTQTNTTVRLDNPTVCLLNAAFGLGGSQFPQRLFSSSMNNAEQALTGYGWMR